MPTTKYLTWNLIGLPTEPNLLHLLDGYPTWPFLLLYRLCIPPRWVPIGAVSQESSSYSVCKDYEPDNISCAQEREQDQFTHEAEINVFAGFSYTEKIVLVSNTFRLVSDALEISIISYW